jgi:hypothetical protein
MNDQRLSVEQARERAKAQAWTTQRILSELESIDLFDPHIKRHCRTLRDELVPALLHAVRERESFARLNASLLLLYLNEPEGTDGVIACLRDTDENLRIRTLSSISVLPLQSLGESTSVWHEPPVPLKRELILTELLRFIAYPDSTAGSIALDVATKLDLPEADRLMRPLLAHSSPKVRLKVLRWLARHGENHGALGVARSLLFASDRDFHTAYWVVAALTDYCKTNRSELAGPAADILADYIRSAVNRPDNQTTNLIWRALKGIAAAHHPEERQLLETVLHSSADDWRRGVALERLGDLEGEAGLERLQHALSDATLRKYAAKSIARTAEGHSLPGLIDALVSAAQTETRERVLGELIGALIAVGVAPATLEQFSDRLNPGDVMRVHWLVNRLTPRMAIDRLVEAGVIPRPEEDVIRKIEDRWQQQRSPYSIILDLLAESHRLTGFDTETGMVTVNYLKLIDMFLDISREEFRAEAFSQEVNPTSGESEIQFVCDERVYSFTARNFGDWYDVEAVIHGLNQALEESESAERFIVLYTGDQTCLVTFAPGAAFRRMARELRLPLEDDVQASMKRGVAFEEYVRSSLGAR